MLDSARTRVTAHILCRPYLPAEEEDVARFGSCLREVLEETNLTLPARNTVPLNVGMDFWSAISADVRHSLQPLHALIFDSDVVLTLVAEPGPRMDIPVVTESTAPQPSQRQYWNRRDAAEEMAKWARDLFFAMNIARPGAAQLMTGHVAVDGFALRIEAQFQHEWHTLRVTSARDGWPIIRELTLTQVRRWLERLPGFEDGFARDATGRAVQSLSHLLYGHDGTVELLWTMIGLEALYTTGEAGLSQQLRDRAQAFLGANIHAPKLINEMYRIRSKFVHGKLNFAGAHHLQDAADERIKSEALLTEAIDVGASMLLASVQQLIDRGWHAVSFRTEVNSD